MTGNTPSRCQKHRFLERGANATRIDLRRASHDAHLDAFEQWIAALRGSIAEP